MVLQPYELAAETEVELSRVSCTIHLIFFSKMRNGKFRNDFAR